MSTAPRPTNSGPIWGLLFWLLVLGLAIKFIWWIAVAAVIAALFFVIRAIVRNVHDRQQAAAQLDAAIARRADEQHNWVLSGDSKGIFGPDGDTSMQSVSPQLPSPPRTEALPVARIAYGKETLDTLLADRPRCWRWAVFGSVLVQRRRAVQWRLNDLTLTFPPPNKRRLHSRAAVGHFVAGCFNELCELTEQVAEFMLTPAFMGMFGDPGDETTADADGILQAANRLMDFYDRFLELAERCGSRSAPGKYDGLLGTCEQLALIPLENYHRFIDDFVARVDAMPELLHFADASVPGGVVEAGPVTLRLELDRGLVEQLTRGLKSLRRAERFATVTGRLFDTY